MNTHKHTHTSVRIADGVVAVVFSKEMSKCLLWHSANIQCEGPNKKIILNNLRIFCICGIVLTRAVDRFAETLLQVNGIKVNTIFHELFSIIVIILLFTVHIADAARKIVKQQETTLVPISGAACTQWYKKEKNFANWIRRPPTWFESIRNWQKFTTGAH